MARQQVTCLGTVGEQAFSDYAPKMWNRLPQHVKSCISFCSFRTSLKYIFSGRFHLYTLQLEVLLVAKLSLPGLSPYFLIITILSTARKYGVLRCHCCWSLVEHPAQKSCSISDNFNR